MLKAGKSFLNNIVGFDRHIKAWKIILAIFLLHM